MNLKANIRDLESLEQLRIAIARFCEESDNLLNVIDSKLESKINNLKSLESHFQRMIESAEDDLRNAKSSLSSCETNTDEDEDGNITYPNCFSEQEDLIDCRKKLELTEHKYSTFKQEIRNLEKSIAEYQNSKVKYQTLIQFEKEAATSSLKQLINGAADYLSVSSTICSGLTNGLGHKEAIAKINPAMILATKAGSTEIIVVNLFSFLGISGSLFSVSNKSKKGLITTTYTENGAEHICSELKIGKREIGKIGKIASINIPFSLQNEKVGKQLVNNMEAICRANDCIEISGWTNSSNVSFYQRLNYQTRNEINETGAEIFKPLKSDFLSSQQKAKVAFETLDNAVFRESNNLGKQEVNPLNIISPDEINDEKFWGQHGENQIRYFDLIEKYDRCREELNNGKPLDQIRKEDSWVANAYDVFHGSEPIRLLKSGDYYRIDSNGRHRVAAAQIYYMQTGKSIPLTADVFENK